MRITLQDYDFELKYVPGKNLKIADHLSRSNLKKNDSEEGKKIQVYVAAVEQNLNISDVRLEELKKETKKDLELNKFLEYIRNGWPENKYILPENVKPYYAFKEELSEYNGLIYKNECVVIPKTLRTLILTKIHYAHFGKEKCKALARKSLFWPGMSKQIEDMIENCNTCQSFQRNNTKEPMIKKEIPDEPWEILASDIFYLLGKHYVMIVDTYSKYIEIRDLKDLTTETTIESLKEIFARYGVPKILYSDSGTQYTSYKFKNFAGEWGLKHQVTTPKFHESNGLAERHFKH